MHGKNRSSCNLAHSYMQQQKKGPKICDISLTKHVLEKKHNGELFFRTLFDKLEFFLFLLSKHLKVS